MSVEAPKEIHGQRKEIWRIADDKKLSQLVKYVVPELPNKGYSKSALSKALQSFLQSIRSKPGPATVAFVARRENYVSPILDIYVLWSHPIQLTSDAQEMREVTADHVESFEPFHPSLNSFLNIVDPRRYPSADVLRRDLSVRAEYAASARVVACALLH